METKPAMMMANAIAQIILEEKKCTECDAEYYSFPKCTPCECNTEGTKDGDKTCNDDGQCNCADNIRGEKCTECDAEYYSFPNCTACECNTEGTKDGDKTCNDDGKCNCADIYG